MRGLNILAFLSFSRSVVSLQPEGGVIHSPFFELSSFIVYGYSLVFEEGKK